MSEPTSSRGSFAAIIATWERLLAGADANREDLPALEPYRAQLEAALADTKAAHELRLIHQAQALQETQELRALLRLGRDLAAQLQSGVKLLYGRRSPKLAEFGIKALLPRARRAGPGCAVKGCPLEASATGK